MPVSDKNVHLQALMIAALSGDKASYAKLLTKVSILLRPYLSKRLANKADVEDVLQEILISLHKARHTYDGKRPFVPWLFAIAKFRLSDHLRSHYSNHLFASAPLEEAENISAHDVTETGFTYESISKRVEEILPEKQANIMKLIHNDGYTAKETAEKLGMKESAVKVAAHRAYKILRKTLSK
jgi:RNA polymerase sigma-70 factor, ECF subfamily